MRDDQKERFGYVNDEKEKLKYRDNLAIASNEEVEQTTVTLLTNEYEK